MTNNDLRLKAVLDTVDQTRTTIVLIGSILIKDT